MVRVEIPAVTRARVDARVLGAVGGQQWGDALAGGARPLLLRCVFPLAAAGATIRFLAGVAMGWGDWTR